YFGYDESSGSVTSSKDQNGNSTTYKYNDPLGRLTEIDYPDGGQTLYYYYDTQGSVSVEETDKIDASGRLYAPTTLFDGAGHVKQSQLNTDPDCSGSD